MSTITLAPRTVHVAALDGELTGASQRRLAAISADAEPDTTVVLDCTGLRHLDSGGIGQLVVMVVHARRRRQRVAAFGLTAHHRAIFAVTRLDQAIALYPDRESALADLR